MKQHISAMTWFRFESNELHPGEWLSLRWHLVGCRECREQLVKRRALDGGAAEPARVSRLVYALPVLLAVFAASHFALQQSVDQDLVIKGGESHFTLLKVQPRGVPLSGECAPGEVLQAEVTTQRRFVIVVGLSATGAQVLYPTGQPRSAEVKNGVVKMPNSWVLDETPGAQRFVAVLSDEPLDIEPTVARVATQSPIANADVLTRQCTKAARIDGGS